MVTSEIPNNALVAYYPFEGNTFDASGLHNDGTLFGPTLTMDRFGRADSAYYFDGIDDYILVPDNDSLEFTSDFSLALWVKPETAEKSETAFLLQKIPTTVGTPIVDAEPPGIQRSTGNQMIFSTAPSFDHKSITSRGIPDGSWSCVVFTYHAVDRAWIFYLNGLVDNQGINDRRQVGTSAAVTIGGFPWKPKPLSLFLGSMDDIAIYQRTLTADEALNYCSNKPLYLTQIETSQSSPQPANIFTPTIRPTVQRTPGCDKGFARLSIGQTAIVTEGVLPNRVRSEPRVADNGVYLLYPGATVKILGGPVCADGLIFWKVENTTIPGGSGWTAEGDGKEYWLEPYQP